MAKFLCPWETVKQCFRGTKHCLALLALLCHWRFICNYIISMGCLLISPVEWGDLCDVKSFMSVLLVNLQQQVCKVFCWIILHFKLQTLLQVLCESFCTHCVVLASEHTNNTLWNHVGSLSRCSYPHKLSRLSMSAGEANVLTILPNFTWTCNLSPRFSISSMLDCSALGWKQWNVEYLLYWKSSHWWWSGLCCGIFVQLSSGRLSVIKVDLNRRHTQQ